VTRAQKAPMENPANLDFPDLPAPLDPLDLAETLLLSMMELKDLTPALDPLV